MTPESDLRAAYPGAADAVALFESFRSTAFMFRAAVGRTEPPECYVQLLKEVADDGAARYPEGSNSMVDAMRRVRHQLDHPDFTRWVAGKLGAY